ALAQGGEMVCAASAGPNAPGLGTRVNSESGFSGECLRTGSLLHCDDSETDPRVYAGSCRMLRIRSMLAALIHSANMVVGLIEIFSERPNAFGVDQSDILRRLSQITSVAVNNATRDSSANSKQAVSSPVDVPDLPIAEVPA